MAFGFLKKALKAAGKVVGAPIKLAAKGTGAITNLVGKVPVIGGGLKGVFTIGLSGPFQLAGNIASGARIDKAVLGHLKSQVNAVKDVAPYAQMVISVVPGVGTGIGAAIAASLALAQGQPINEAILSAVKSAIPGGAIAQSAFNITSSVVSGKSLDKVALSALPLDAKQKQALETAVNAAKAIAAGQRVDKAVFDNAQKLLPPAVQKATQIAVAVAEGQRLQTIAKNNVNVATLGNLAKEGAALANLNPVLKAGASVLKSAPQKSGFTLGISLMAKSGVTPIAVNSIRAKLEGQQKLGFDMALAAHVGLVETKGKKAPAGTTNEQKFGFIVAKGMVGAPEANRAGMMKAVALVPGAKAGAISAVRDMAPVNAVWWRRVLIALGLQKKVPVTVTPQLTIKVTASA